MILEYCGNEPPLNLYHYDNWAHMPTSNDQKCIEAVLPQYVNKDAVWLHVGIGNSSLAKLFCSQIKRLDGITVCQEEIDTAPKFENYLVRICNKHGEGLLNGQTYDVVIDTTPCGHACCWHHFRAYLKNVFSLVTGVYLTDKVGLAWAQPTFKGMTPEQFGEYIAEYGMKYRMLTDTVVEITCAS